MGAVTRRLLTLAVAAGLFTAWAPVVAAASPVTFGTPAVTSTFLTGVTFSQPVTVTGTIKRVELLLTIADEIGPTIIEVPNPPGPGSATLTNTLDTAGGAHMIPNTPITARWRLFAADTGAASLGPEVHVVYADDRFDWQTATGSLVRVHWYQGNAAFGAKALKLGEDEVAATSKLLGVTETRPIDFFVYADQDKFYDALGPGAHENVAGSAFANIRTMLGLIPPDQIDDPQVAVRIPHEFVHLVFDTASKNPYHSPPRWLNEGLAVYQSQSFDASDRGAVEDAARNGTLIPLDGLTGQFPNGDDFFLAYSESVAAVDFMIRTYGSDALVSLVRSYADGRTDDEAFKAALGLDMTAFGAAWFKSVNATPKQRYGPQPAPAGPVPSAWTGAAPGGTSAPGSSAAASGAGSGAPSASAGTTPGPDTTAAGGSTGAIVLLVVVIAVVVVVVVLVARRRRLADGGDSP